MTMEIGQPPTSIIGYTITPDSTPPRFVPLVLIVILAFVLHLAGGAMLDQSHASPSFGPAASAALDDETGCTTEPPHKAPALPYD
jgi:hypothetical protein